MNGQGFSIKSKGIFGFVVMIGVLVLLFFAARGIFRLLAFAAPVLIVLALIINYRTVVNYIRFVLGLFRKSVLTGLIAVILSVFGFPILSGVLFAKSILDRKVKKLKQSHQQQVKNEFVDYEEVIRPEREDSLELPKMQKQAKPEEKQNPYKDLF